MGIISEPNAHPVNSEEMEQPGGVEPAYVVAVLNGDVDNHADLKVAHGLRFPGPITTDAKVIPALVARHAEAVDGDLVEAFRRTVSSFEGSVAIGVATADEPQRLLFALHGSGQGVYIGLAEDRFVVASEPYGVVEETDRYVRLDGEHGGQIVVLDGDHAGELAGIRRFGYDGSEQPVTEADVDRRRGHHPRHRPRELAALPPQGDHRVAGQLRQDAARARSPPATTAGCAPSSARGPCHRAWPSVSPPDRSGGCG